MSSKRGRKRNDNLPPNRARDVQRAFRARRAAHLQALEQRVTELEDENNCLRQALSLPPANRPLLGKGPTGKDKPRSFEQTGLITMNSGDSSDSPPSTRMSSHSPEATVWGSAIVTADSLSNVPSSSAPPSYPISSMSAPSSSKMHYNPYPSRTPMYLNSSPNYPQSPPLASSYPSPNFAPMRMDGHDEHRSQYSYSPLPYDHSIQNTPPQAPLHNHSQHEASLPYPARRPLTEPQVPYTVDSGFSQLPSPMSHQGIRLPSPPKLEDAGGGHSMPAPRNLYDHNVASDGRTLSMS